MPRFLAVSLLICFSLSLLLSRPATALATAVPYTGQLLSGTAALNGSYDFQFTLYNAATGGSTVGSTLSVSSLTVANGVFYVELDFGSVFTGTTLYLQTAYRKSGTSSYTTQSSRKLFSLSGAADYAALSGSTTSLQGFFVSARAPTDGQVLTWNASGSKWLPQTPVSGTAYTAGTGLSLSGTQFSVASGGITNSLIASNAVSNAKLANGSVSGAKLSLPLTASASSDSDLFTITNTGNGRAIVGSSSNSTALKGVGYNGVYGQGTHYGVQASGTQYGVYSVTGSSTGTAVYGANTSSDNGDYGLLGGTEPISGNNYPVGVYGSDSQGGYGVYGHSTNGGLGVYGVGTYGVWGVGTNYGVFGGGADNTPNTTGVLGIGSQYGIYGNTTGAAGAFAGHFTGNVEITGTLSKAGGSFKIDDPIDPANKFLYHSFVESPDMMNLYNGNVTTDANGNATILMPAYFQALNQDFRYQLTVIGQFAQAIVATEINHNTFTIKTDKPKVKVSWMVTGIRHDAWANAHRIPTEEDKPAAEQGLYLHPKELGQPEQMGIDFEHRSQAARTPTPQK